MWDFDKFGDNIALISENGIEISYNELSNEGKQIVDGIDERCLVVILCRNTIGAIGGYSAFINGHIVPILLSASLDMSLIEGLIDRYKPHYLWIPQEMRDDFHGVYEVYNQWDYCMLKTSYDTKHILNDELCILLTTSGSTGSPKFVRQSYKNVKVNAESIVNYLDLTMDERPITTLPMNYTYGLSIINSHFMVGASLLVTDKGIMQKEFWSFFKTYNATSFGGVPYTYEMLDRLRFVNMKLPSLRYMTQAGGKLLPELHYKFAQYAYDTGRKFYVMYGQCEATARMGYLPSEDAVRKCGSMGIAIPGGEFWLIDDDENKIEQPGIKGELVYAGDNVTLGYAVCGEDLIKGDERNGILRTGDIAYFDDEGYYYIVGRKKRFLKMFGNRVSLDEIQTLIKKEFKNIEVAVTGVDDKMCIFLTEDKQSADVRKYVSDVTKLNSSAIKVFVIDEIPKNDAGKILFYALDAYCN